MSGKPVHPLRALRNRFNLTQKRLAEEAGVGAQTILRAEHNKPINAESRRLLSEYFGMRSEELGLVVDEKTPEKNPLSCGNHVAFEQLPGLSEAIAQGIVLAVQELEGQHMDKSRRNFLQVLGLASTAMTAPSSPAQISMSHDVPVSPLWERLTKALASSSPIDEETLLQVEASTRDCWRVLPNVLGSFSRNLLQHTQRQLEVVTDLLESAPPQATRTRLAAVAGEFAQVAGEILFDLKENGQAEQYYNVAIAAAEVAQDDVMRAVALGRKSFIPIYEQNAQSALPLLQEAHLLTAHNAPMVMRAWLSAIEAEALANMYDETACRKALDRSERFLEVAQPAEVPLPRFNYSTLLGYKGVCALRLKQPEHAQVVLNESLKIMEPHRLRHKAIVLVDLATSYVLQQEIEEACRCASQSLLLIAELKSSRVFQRVMSLRAQLEPWQTTAVVKRLDEQIAVTRPFVALAGTLPS
jgi:transcriptional regulator with XRE-family HTH domain